MRDYNELLKNAPAHDSPEFIDYLRKHNEVVFESGEWIVIENAKYHKPESPWLTAFWKGHKCEEQEYGGSDYKCDSWWVDTDELWYHEDWAEWEWLKKAANKQTVPGRFHIHLIKKP